MRAVSGRRSVCRRWRCRTAGRSRGWRCRPGSAAGAQAWVVVVGAGIGGEGRVVQFVQRRRTETFAVGATQDQLAERLEAERIFRIAGAAEVAVLVVADRRAEFQAVQHRHVEFGVLRLQVALAADRGGGIDAEALHVAGEVLDVLVERLLAELAAQRQGRRPGAEPVADLPAGAGVQALDAADRGTEVAAQGMAAEVGEAGVGLRPERVQRPVGDAEGGGAIIDVAAVDMVDHLVLVVRGADIVVPAGEPAVEAEQQALAGVLRGLQAWPEHALPPVDLHRPARVEDEAAGTGSDAVAGIEGGAGIDLQAGEGPWADLGSVVVARPEVLQADVVLVGQLAGGAAEHRGLLGFRHQVEVAPQALPADAVARDQVGALATAGGQRIAGVGALAPVAGEGGAGAVVEAASRLVVVGVAAVLGAEAFLLVVVGHREDIEAILLQLAEAPASADVALVAAAVVGGEA